MADKLTQQALETMLEDTRWETSWRAGVNTGGRMTQQRTLHDLRSVGRSALAGYWARLMDQVNLVNFSGTRGAISAANWVALVIFSEKMQTGYFDEST